MGRFDAHPLLPFPEAREWTPEDWQRQLSEVLGQRVHVRYGRSRTTPVIYHRDPEASCRVRLHRFFAHAPQDIVDALSRWLRAGRRARRACDRLDAWIAEQVAALPRSVPSASLRAQGRVHDLGILMHAVMTLDVPELLGRQPKVTWGRRQRSRSVRSLQLGSYDPERHLIRIHPVLDHVDVPEFFVRNVLFHELLHAASPEVTQTAGRRAHHPASFRRRERAHRDFERARAFEAANLTRLIRRARQRNKSRSAAAGD